MFSGLRKSKNEYVQGTIFAANLLLKEMRHRQNLRKVRQRNSLISTSWQLEKYKTSDTLFLLGSGGSIASYSNAQFDIIRQHDSAGFNFWLLHEFVPTYFTAEFKPNCQRSDALWGNLDKRSVDYKDVPVFFKYSPTFLKECPKVPTRLTSTHLATQLSIPGTKSEVLAKWFGYLVTRDYFTPRMISQCILYKQASLSWLISFGLQLGYKRIVLCGVDLNSPHYFYDLDDSYVRENDLEIPSAGFKGPSHPTESSELAESALPISQVLQVIDETILNTLGVELLIGSESSALYPQFPVYQWE